MGPMAVTYEARRFADGGSNSSYPSMPSMHNDDSDRFPVSPEVSDLDMSPFHHGPSILGDDVMDSAALDSDVPFTTHSDPSAAVAAMHDAITGIAVPEDELEDELEDAASSMAEAASVAAAAAAAAAIAMSAPETADASLGPALDPVPEPLSSRGSLERSSKVKKPGREATKGPDGLYHCTWPRCDDAQRSFARRCEFNKHMDKHERPYRCVDPGCEKLVGFTYSGGLMRHEREVHGMHGGPKHTVNCPHESCKRHTGRGFSRQENLNEHMRRLHGDTSGLPELVSLSSAGILPPHERQQQQLLHQLRQQEPRPQQPQQPREYESKMGDQPGSKRSRPSSDGNDDDGDDDRGYSYNELRMRRLDQENRDLREKLAQLELETVALKKQIEDLQRVIGPPASPPEQQHQPAQLSPDPPQRAASQQHSHEQHDEADVGSDGRMV